ncbi:MAG TPA: hypothetical protein PLO52_01460 [Flavobacterium alvei]|nr:hypothetical protein [Flavobacterium alvei]
MAYTLPNGITTDWALHDNTYKPGTDRNGKVTDFFLIPWVKKQIAVVGDLPGSPTNGDAYMIGGTEVRRWNANTSSYDIFILTGAFIFYDQFLDTYFTWTFGSIESRDNSVLNQPGDMLYFDGSLQRLASGNDFDVLQYVGGLPTAARLPLYDLRIKRPSFTRNGTDTQKIVIPASVSNPSRVKIGDKFYVSTTNKILNFLTSGRNGITTGTITLETAYYLYAIPPVSGNDYDIVIDLNDPTIGPTAFTGFDPLDGWSYIGSFATNSTTEVPWFTYSDGIFAALGITPSFNVDSTTTTALVLANVSAVAKEVQLQGEFTALDTSYNNLNFGSNAVDITQFMNASDTAAHSPVLNFWVTIQTPQTVYANVTGATTVCRMFVWGWRECPTDFA